MNVNMVDKEKAKKNVELRKKKADYKPYEEEECVDDMVIVRKPCSPLFLGAAQARLAPPPWTSRGACVPLNSP